MSRILMSENGEDQCALGILDRGEKNRGSRIYL